MSGTHLLVIFIILVALIFDYINGFHDAANSIATVVSTRVLSPMQAVAWAAFFNFVAAFGFGVNVATTIGVKAGFGSLIPSGLAKILAFIVLSPLLGMVVGFILMVTVYRLFQRARPGQVDSLFRRLQLVSAAAYSLGHGT
ncbi:MAG: inorganic phosphate transporter, partial [candidate division NC10 bacterium]|nr:inorganic phosphate transporter [candidate division NC10 bacterium]